MLKFLSIQNIVLIDKAEIEFSSGLCILSGETGSGKSILLDALGLAIGFRSSLRQIGSDNNKACVNAQFDITNNDICKNILKENDLLDEENNNFLNIRRVIQENSANKTYVNDISIGVNLLSKIGESLVEIHGQHDQRGLLNSRFHSVILDEFSKNQNILKDLKKVYLQLKETDKKILELKNKKEQALKEKDYLEYIIKELENADVKQGEEDELITQKDLLNGSEKITSFFSELRSNLTQANSELTLSQKILIKNYNIIDNYIPSQREVFEELSELIDQNTIALESAISNIQNMGRDMENPSQSLDEVEERLFHIRSLSRKFNTTIDELPNIIDDAQEKLKIIENEETFTHQLEEEKSELLKEYKKIADILSQRRKESALLLSEKVETELKFVKMENTKFQVEISNLRNSEDNFEYRENGYDKVQFLSSINKNGYDDISKIASGGELSRFMLALKVALMDIKSTPTMIFDEIDAGIGGSTADAVGRRLKILSKNLQIFAVTHQPQIASKADTHFKIRKTSDKEKVKTLIEKLDSEKREIEIARMLSGEEITPEAIAAANRLINAKIN